VIAQTESSIVYGIGLALTERVSVRDGSASREGLREHGYEEGRNIAIEYRWADGEYERFPALVTELIAAKVDVIVTAGTPAALR
jgi:ABC-type uncharacterized transport system substrate-binding protein